MSAIAADGKLAEEEYAIISPLLKAFFNREVTYEECQKAFKEYKKEELRTVELFSTICNSSFCVFHCITTKATGRFPAVRPSFQTGRSDRLCAGTASVRRRFPRRSGPRSS